MRVAASVLLLFMAEAAIAGPLEDAEIAFKQKDYTTALRLILPLAEQGNVAALMRMGDVHAYGLGVPKNEIEAGKWFKRAAEQNDPRAMWFLSTLYERGRFGLPQDFVEKRKWLFRAAEQGHINSQTALALLHDNGEGLVKDPYEAAKWYTRAAMQGDQHAQFTLGGRYENGVGVRQDYVLAHMWFNLAASAPTPDDSNDFVTIGVVMASRPLARDMCDWLAKKMTPAQIAEAQKLARDWKPRPEKSREIIR